MAEPIPNLTRLLKEFSAGDGHALDPVLPFLYADLRRLARGYFKKERPDHTLQPTALIHEVLMRFMTHDQVPWENRRHFFGAAAQAMRRILIESARNRKALKRGGDLSRAEYAEDSVSSGAAEPDLVLLDEALRRLAEVDERAAKVVELRYFGGLTLEEIAQLLEISLGTVKRDWTLAKTWLHHDLKS